MNWANAASWMLSTVPNTGADHQFARLEKMSAVLEAYKDLVKTDRERYGSRPLEAEKETVEKMVQLRYKRVQKAEEAK